ncbi:hypothetical protein [Gilliamella apis]|uniref:hypothetical protein n=1 Tax=Gilliamella apis TaxID=1970738 RepID=UPI000A330CAA|nr:hypothetical protein [Gilliamella apis]OTQ54791.1 hypothetical protein B6D21_09695 [Gilliamella apis]
MINIHEIRSKQNIKSLFASVPQSLLIADRQSDPRNAYTDNALQANSIAINIGCLFFFVVKPKPELISYISQRYSKDDTNIVLIKIYD